MEASGVIDPRKDKTMWPTVALREASLQASARNGVFQQQPTEWSLDDEASKVLDKQPADAPLELVEAIASAEGTS